MKRIIALTTCIFFLNAANAASSSQDYPPDYLIHSIGNNFTRAYDAGDDYWVLWTNEGYNYNGAIWLTTFYPPLLPHNIDEATALKIGKELFDHTLLLATPIRKSINVYDYTPKNSDYAVIVGHT